MIQLSISIFLHLLSLLLSFSSISIVSGGRSTMGSVLSYMLDDIESEITSEDRKRKAFDTLFSNVDKASWHSKCLDEFYNDNECRTRIMMVCLAEVEHRITTNDTSRISNDKLGKLMKSSMANGALDRMIDNEFVFIWIFDGICNGEEEDHTIFSSILSQFANDSGMEQRVTLIVRYFNGLKASFNSIFSRCVVSVDTMMGFFEDYDGYEMAGLFAVLHSAFARWVTKTTKKDKVCDIIIKVLELSLDCPLTLENLLGEDLLSISSYLSRLPSSEYSGISHANIFECILDLHPEFKQQFRGWTKNGKRGNPIAELGRSIPPKELTRQGVNYIFYEEENEE